MSGRGSSSRGVGGGRGGVRGGGRGRGRGGGDRGGRGGRGGIGGGANAFVVKPSYKYVAEYSDEVSQVDSMPLISKLPASQPKKRKNLSECTIALRPGYGTLGTKTNVGTNFVDYKIMNLTFYSYFVTFPKELETKRKVRAELMDMLLDKAPFNSSKKTISHNNSDTFYSTVPIPIEDSKDKKVSFTFTDEELKGVVPGPKRGEKPRSGPFAVTVEFIHKLDMNDLQKSVSLIGDNKLESGPYINALNVSLGYQISKSKNVYSIGTNRFFFVDKPQACQSFQRGLYLVNGFFASIVPTFNNIVINVNSAAGAFIKSHNKDGTPMSVADLVGDYFGTENLANLDPKQLMRHKSFFKGIKITRDYLGHNSRPKSLHDIDTRVTANSQKFDVDGKEMSVTQYFKSKYKITLKYPNLPLIHMGGTNYTPMEVCTVFPGQQFKGEITDVKGMLDFTTHRPPAISGLIQKEGLKIIAKGDPESRIGKKLMVVPSRVLDPVVVHYANGNVSYVPKPFDGKSEDSKGSWNLNARKFYRGIAKPLNLLVVALEEASRPMGVEQRDLCKRAITTFVAESNKYGIKYNKEYLLRKVVIKNPHELEREMEDLARAQKGKSGFILWLLPQNEKSLYSSIKKVCDVRVGIPNQCAIFSKFTKERFGKFDLSMYGLMGMKSCIKLGGVNHVLHDDYSKLLMKNNLPTLLLGADVSHPTGAGAASGTDIAPSITSVVGSVDGFFNTFPGSISYQTGKVEMIADMEKMCIERILAYHKKVGKLPQDVIFYRDGVSEGQFDLLLKNEVPFVKAAFTKIKNKFDLPNYSPKLTFVIIVKRHNTRFFPLDKDAKTPNGKQIAVQAKENIIAGSIVDKGITSVKYYDFYLQSQQALQGTAVPGHYYVLYDEANYKPDEIQKITYGLCNIFARATKSVRVVPPAYYADLLCERGSCYFNGVQGSRSKTILQAAKEMYPGTHPDVADTMVYI